MKSLRPSIFRLARNVARAGEVNIHCPGAMGTRVGFGFQGGLKGGNRRVAVGKHLHPFRRCAAKRPSAGLVTVPETRWLTCPTTAPIALATPACVGQDHLAPQPFADPRRSKRGRGAKPDHGTASRAVRATTPRCPARPARSTGSRPGPRPSGLQKPLPRKRPGPRQRPLPAGNRRLRRQLVDDLSRQPGCIRREPFPRPVRRRASRRTAFSAASASQPDCRPRTCSRPKA